MSKIRSSRPVFVQGGNVFIYDPVNNEYDMIDSQNLVAMVQNYQQDNGDNQPVADRVRDLEEKLDYLINALNS